jgi:hypothetical protein
MARRWALVAMAALVLPTVASTDGVTASVAIRFARASTRTAPGYSVFWDQNEEEDQLAVPSNRRGILVPPWDPNGQLCVVPDGSGRFVVGYNPTLASQHNPGSKKPYKAPPVGEALYDRHGHFTGRTLFLPGPYKLPGQRVGGDIPPDTSKQPPTFNENGTFTGCVFDAHRNLFASDLGTAQGQFPPPDSGRLIEWFAPDYRRGCVVDGPTEGGVGPHHVDGTGGLRQPGDLALDTNGDLMVPEAGTVDAAGLPAGRVLRFDHASLPRRASECPDELYPRTKLRTSVFFQGGLAELPFPLSIARDPACNCWAIASTIGDPAIVWFTSDGQPMPGHAVIHGAAIADVGKDPNGFNPFGIAFAPDGTLYFVDIHLTCTGTLTGCGPATKGGRVLRVSFANGTPSTPTAIATGLDFPTSVTVCATRGNSCPV